jgi:hypothetical protein
MVGGVAMPSYAEQLKPEWLQDAVRDFRHVAELAGYSFRETAFQIEYLPAPHRLPSRLPPGKMAVYAFYHQGQCMKVAKLDRTVRLGM